MSHAMGAAERTASTPRGGKNQGLRFSIQSGELRNKCQLDQELDAKKAELRTKRNLLAVLRKVEEGRELQRFMGTMPVFLIVPRVGRILPCSYQIC